ncbi:hypothetical protein GE061_000519 [Apolygus lucorum]|uniref:ADAMTS cysteine-rich domain-containing protein n=1 Tax=Apolygus lucorum TaxID=248454 RepID=A0A8S9Y619_APOLU|nr:hypothetical protein GE061_000519 [Apolygus lucorum]
MTVVCTRSKLAPNKKVYLYGFGGFNLRSATLLGSLKKTDSLITCPKGSPEDYSRQCAKFNGQLLAGNTYTWVPFHRAGEECVLNCRAVGHRFYARLKPKLEDGTPCGRDKVCFAGRCLKNDGNWVHLGLERRRRQVKRRLHLLGAKQTDMEHVIYRYEPLCFSTAQYVLDSELVGQRLSIVKEGNFNWSSHKTMCVSPSRDRSDCFEHKCGVLHQWVVFGTLE